MDVVSPVFNVMIFTMNVARDVSRVRMPTVMYDPWNAWVQVYAKNMNGHAKLPGAFVYLKAQSNSPKSAIVVTTMPTKAWNPQYRLATRLPAQLLA